MAPPRVSITGDTIGQTARNFIDGVIPESLRDIIEGTSRVAQTRTRSDTAASFHLSRLGRTAPVGAIYEFVDEQGRVVEDVFSVGPNPDGLPSDTIGQQLSGRTLRLGRFELWDAMLIDVFGLDSDELISNQAGVFSIRQTWRGPSVFPGGGLQQSWAWLGCKFVSFSKPLSTIGDRVVRASATINWRRKIRLG